MTRALTPAVGAVLLVAATVALAGLTGAIVLGSGPAASPPHARLTLDVDAGADRVAVTHEGGDALSAEALTVRIEIDGRALAHQPPVPFFAARGFVSGPTGPFNSGGDTTWTAGETAALELASTNAPAIDPGGTVAVTVATDRGTVARLEAVA
ncbi:type IV pilin N-terminal domain-containing protein [Halapricum desulfuricans]|uniref:Pilin/Flagellin, FlaG/FlaF family n=1 Tax=Halapricum desulfuricans TaxID=2841257 RepID=A0A897MX26_9EURY|nr:type IV pilin N-terminal domain-containing protein [Halapricum desulfuricans]QSG04831.1 Pilin/Flagellin, FlaG/FlaF family [Halapricum desulfuricans]